VQEKIDNKNVNTDDIGRRFEGMTREKKIGLVLKGGKNIFF
jgi:hypothetical protein